MYWLTELIGGKKFFAWIVGLILTLFGRISPETLQILTMGYMLAEAVDDGVNKPTTPPDWTPLRRFWSLLGGRACAAFLATTGLLWFHRYDETMWLEVTAAFAGKVVLENGITAFRKARAA